MAHYSYNIFRCFLVKFLDLFVTQIRDSFFEQVCSVHCKLGLERWVAKSLNVYELVEKSLDHMERNQLVFNAFISLRVNTPS
jgi:hypothetical protein